MSLPSRLCALALAAAVSLGGSVGVSSGAALARDHGTPERVAREAGASPQAIAAGQVVRVIGQARPADDRVVHHSAALRSPAVVVPAPSPLADRSQTDVTPTDEASLVATPVRAPPASLSN